ncbi:hypothetical protein FACS1894151_09940 [Spirochaetia bacterium]|nr:hypothetical protein FACS1894151_09940 [Spirochaetia bacterium]
MDDYYGMNSGGKKPDRKFSRPARASKPAAGSSPASVFLYRLLLVILIVVVLGILGGTIYGLVFRTQLAAAAELREKISEGSSTVGNGAALADGQMFSGLGKLRITTASPHISTVILSVVFPYDPKDNAFAEELAVHVTEFRNMTSEYIGGMNTEQLHRLADNALKTALLERYNSALRLGKIPSLYFSDYIILE